VASLRQKFSVRWAGGEDVEITTTVRDLITAVDNVKDSGHSSNKVAIETSLIHAALARSTHKVPPYEEWLDQLDMYVEVPSSNGVGPTQQAASPTGRSSLPVLQEQTGAAGSGQTAAKSQTAGH
jgi:hypothetical protein